MEPKNEGVPPEIAGQFKEIAETHGTNISMVRNLWLGGVKAEDLGLVVDIRDSLSVQPHENHKTGNWQIVNDTVSSKVMARAYRALGGDIELLESLAEEVIEEAGRMNPFFGQRTAILTGIVDKIVDGERQIFSD